MLKTRRRQRSWSFSGSGEFVNPSPRCAQTLVSIPTNPRAKCPGGDLHAQQPAVACRRCCWCMCKWRPKLSTGAVKQITHAQRAGAGFFIRHSGQRDLDLRKVEQLLIASSASVYNPQAMPALLSAAPRPKSSPPSTSAEKGGCCQSSCLPSATVSMWPIRANPFSPFPNVTKAFGRLGSLTASLAGRSSRRASARILSATCLRNHGR